jgi:type I restriction enzyme, R subunit
LAGEKARIIIITLQKFPVVLQRGVELPDCRYAVIIDEAHSSQTGEAAKDLKVVLGANATDEVELTAAEAGRLPPRRRRYGPKAVFRAR